MENELMSLPMVALRGLAVLPEQVTHFDVSREKSVQAITQAMKKDQKIFLVMQKKLKWKSQRSQIFTELAVLQL